MQRPKRILAVDDNPIFLRILEPLLADYTLQTAASGAEALEIAPQFRPDVVLLDIVMPGIDGYDTCRQIHDIPSLHHTKIIMVSAKSDLNERLEGYRAGADDYVTKPFDGDELIAKVRVYLRLISVEEIEEVKTRTIEVLQHSNRTPLTNIISNAELLSCGLDLDDETRAQSLRVILCNARRLHQMLEKGERLACMKTGQFFFEFKHGDMCDVIRDVVEEMAAQLSDRGVSIELRIPSSANAKLDYRQMQVVIRALLDNAIRFSEPGAIITVEVIQRDGELVLTVADHGAGISAELLPGVFEPFGNQESPLLNRGDGLSLAIVQQIAWAHDGDVWAESELGCGATFSMRIPIGDRVAERKWSKQTAAQHARCPVGVPPE